MKTDKHIVLSTLLSLVTTSRGPNPPLSPIHERGHIKSVVYTLVAALVGTTMFAANANACVTYASSFSTTWRNDANADLNDYSRIFIDADDPNCSLAAMYFLAEKVRNELNGSIPSQPTKKTFQRWLDGYKVAVIFAAAHRLGANGWAGRELDDQLALLETRFAHFVPTPTDLHPTGDCGGDAVNTCMDDLAGTASGYAWIAAYQRRRPHRVPDLGYAKRVLAEQYLRDALTPVQHATDRAHGICLRRTPTQGYGFPLCNTTDATLLGNGMAETLSVNNGQQYLAYGFGLMTSIGIAKMGLEEAGSTFTFSANEKAIAKALFEEAQRHINGSAFTNDCYSRNASGQLVKDKSCGVVYQPNMYRLKPLYDKYFNGVPAAGSYTSNFFDVSLFNLGNATPATEFFSFNRYVTYGILANTWVGLRAQTNNAQPELMPYDANNPIGWLDGISSSGLAQGWACDKDKPTGSVKIDFYVDSWTFAVDGYANSGSEPALNNICGGGTAHRFFIQLPPWTKGKDVRAYALDYTWVGSTHLGCGQSTPLCKW